MRLAFLILPAILLTACVTEGEPDTASPQATSDCTLIDAPADRDACRAYEKAAKLDTAAERARKQNSLPPNRCSDDPGLCETRPLPEQCAMNPGSCDLTPAETQ